MQENTPLNKFDKYLKKSKTFKKYIGKNVGSFYIEIVTYQVSWSFIFVFINQKTVKRTFKTSFFGEMKIPFEFVYSFCELTMVIPSQKAGVKCSYESFLIYLKL